MIQDRARARPFPLALTFAGALNPGMIQDYPSSDRPTWHLIGKETLAGLATGLLFPFGLARPKRKTPRKREQRTVVFVHGYLANPSLFYPLRAYLRARGVRQVLLFSYRSSEGVVPAARGLKEFLRRHVRGGRIDLVCHSMGGVVSRVYLQELGGHRRVDRCITLGTPHRGTYNAYWIPSRVGRELRPDSPLIRRLRLSRKVARGVRFMSIAAGSDNIIIPRVFSANERTVRIPDLGHLGMMFSPTVFREVGDALEARMRRLRPARVTI